MPRIVRVPGLKEPLTFPTGTPDYEIYAAVADALFPVEELPPAPKPEAGFIGGFKEGITSLGGAPEAVSYLGSPTEETRRAAAASAESPYQFQRLEDVESVGQGARLFRELAGQSIGFMAPPLAAAAAAGVVSGPAAPIVAPLTFLGVAGLQYLTETTGRQAQVQEAKAAKGEATEAPDVTKIVASSAAQAGVDLIPFTTIFKPVGRLFGLAGRESAEKVARETVETFEKEGFEAAAKKLSGLNPKQSMALGFGAGALVEGVQEPLQTLLERWGAGLDLSSDEALKEYMEAAILGPILGGPFGAISTGIGNVQRGMSNKDFLNRLQAEVEGKPIPQDQLARDWDRQKAEILKTAEPISLVDEEGKPQKITPELLESLGVSPNAKAISIGSSSVPMPTLLEKDMSDKSVQTILAGMFQRRMGQISQEIKQRGSLMSQEERESKLAEYVQAAQSFKSILNIASPENAINSPTNFIVQPSPADPDKFVLFNPVTSQIAKGKDGKERQYSSLQNAERALNRLIGKEVSEIGKKIDVATQPEKAAEAKKAEKEKKLAEIEDPFAKPATPETAAKAPISDEQRAQISEKTVVGTEEPVGPVDEGDITGDLDEISFKPSAEPTPTPTGFRTAQGSMYKLDEAGRTSRTKKSPGKGQGKTYPPHLAFYVTPEDSRSILDDKIGGNASIRLGYDRDGKLKPIRDITELPEGATPLVVVVDNDKNTARGVYRAKTKPEIGLSPVEKLYNKDGTANTHVGNPIVEMFSEPTAAPVLDATQKLEAKEDAELEAGILKDEQVAAQAAITPEVNQQIQEALTLAEQAIKEGEGRTFFPEDIKQANDFVGAINNVYAGLESGTLPYARQSVDSLIKDANSLKQAFQQRIADRDKFEAEQKAKEPGEGFKLEEKPDLKLVKTEKKPRKTRTKKVQTPAEVIHMPPPAEVIKSRPDMIADQIAALDGEDGGSGEFNDIAEAARGMKNEAKLDKVLDLATRLKNAYDTAQGKKAGVSEADRNAAAAQINKIYDELDALQSGEIPVTSEGVKSAMEKNGNAKESEKIASESRKDICE